MEDVIAIKIKDRKRGNVAFITWGRIFDRINTKIITQKIAHGAKQYGINDIKSIVVCDTLQGVAHYPFFFEAIILISWKPIPYGKKYAAWVSAKKAEITIGKEMYFLGSSKKY